LIKDNFSPKFFEHSTNSKAILITEKGATTNRSKIGQRALNKISNMMVRIARSRSPRIPNYNKERDKKHHHLRAKTISDFNPMVKKIDSLKYKKEEKEKEKEKKNLPYFGIIDRPSKKEIVGYQEKKIEKEEVKQRSPIFSI